MWFCHSKEILAEIRELRKELKMTSQVVQDIQAEVAAIKTVDDSAKALLERLFAIVDANKDDPVALAAALNDLRAGKDELAGAVSANTPAT